MKTTKRQKDNIPGPGKKKTFWNALSDIQKSKVLLDSKRMPDEDQFILVYKSFEFPDPERNAINNLKHLQS